jgi:hypothetical protein
MAFFRSVDSYVKEQGGTFNLKLVFPCGTEKFYENLTHIKGVKVNGKRPTEAYVSGYKGKIPEGVSEVLHPYNRKIFINGEFVQAKGTLPE